MYGRVSTYELAPERSSEATAAFTSAIERIRELDGLVDAYFLVDRDSLRAVTITFWDTVDTMERSRVAASRARSDAAHAIDATVVSTCEYEVGAHVGAELLGRVPG